MKLSISWFAALVVVVMIGLTFSSCRVRHHTVNGKRSERVSGNDGGDSRHVGKQIIKMREENGVYYIPVKIDDVPMEFIYDTGAAIVSISVVEAEFLYRQGKLSDADVVGEGDFGDANGTVTKNTIVILHNVTVGDYTIHDVQAAVSENQNAPLLFGQTAMKRFGKVTFDYENDELIIE